MKRGFFNIKTNFTLSLIFLFIFFSLIIFYILVIQMQIVDLMVYSSGIDLIKDIKNSQYLAIVREKPLILEIKDNRYRIYYEDLNFDYVNRNPLFESVFISSNGDKMVIKSDGSFENDNLSEITLKKWGISYKIKLEENGKINIFKNY